MAQLNLKDIELMNPGHLGCPGCGATIAMKFALQALGKKTMVVIPACCWGVIAGPYPQSALNIPVLHTAFATAGAAASGLRAARDRRGDTETTVLSWAGDGGTFDIGFQSLSGAVERNEDCIFVCYDNGKNIRLNRYPGDFNRHLRSDPPPSGASGKDMDES